MEIPERDWLKAGFFWAALALLSALPWIGVSWAGETARILIRITAVVHAAEAFYAASVARRARLDPLQWAVRALVLGYLSLRRLQEAAAPGIHTR